MKAMKYWQINQLVKYSDGILMSYTLSWTDVEGSLIVTIAEPLGINDDKLRKMQFDVGTIAWKYSIGDVFESGHLGLAYDDNIEGMIGMLMIYDIDKKLNSIFYNSDNLTSIKIKSC